MNNQKLNSVLPVVALRNLTILPDMIIHFDVSRKKSILAAEHAMMEEQKLFLLTQRNGETEDPGMEELYHVGTVALIKQVTKLPGNIVRVLVEGLEKGKLISFDEGTADFLLAEVEILQEEEVKLEEEEREAITRHLKELFAGYCSYYPKIGKTLIQNLEHLDSPDILMNQIVITIPLKYEMKQQMLEQTGVRERYEFLAKTLYSENEIARLKSDLSEKIKGRVEKNQRDYLLREQLHYIREELGEESTVTDADQFETDCQKLKAPKEIKEKIIKEISRFRNIAGSSSESAVERAYIETLLEMPWNKASKDSLDIDLAEQILEADHYGLSQVKERILEFLAVRSLTKQGDSPILCLVGPPGTGKTSIARSVARALDKKYVRICLGGVRDEAEIRGHRKTYVGAMPGRIASGLKQAGVKNPLMLLDEIDKVSSDYKGDTSAALLEVLDGEQNSKFRDHYIELPIDLSEVLFIATANSVSTIPRPLLDRMELIEVTSYTANEKFHIAREHLVGKQLGKNGLTAEQLSISDNALRQMIQNYTREAGVRGLERKIGELCRKSAREILQKHKSNIQVTSVNLEKYLGKRKYSQDKKNETDEIGIVRGLAWTSVGGDTLQIEVNMMPGKGEVRLTGKLGEVMQESAMTGMSYIRSISGQYKITSDTFKKNDFHIHIPEGAVPKDGPSAGITMATAVLSAITGIPVRADLAMTGEITLRGRVLPIGGLKEKILAAKTAGINKVLVPKENTKDIDEIAKEIKTGINIVTVETMEDVVKQAFAENISQKK